LLAASGCRIIRNMRTTKREQRVTVRLSDSLVGELKAEAVQDGRPLADYVRRLLVDAVAARVVQREQPTA
jgi:predicted DNA binding CopG/RHH family protein